MVGSQHIMLDSALGEQTAASFAVPDIAKALDGVGADNLAVHTNPLQEADQQRGGSRPATARGAIESAAAALDWLHRFIEELRICLPGRGAADVAALAPDRCDINPLTARIETWQ